MSFLFLEDLICTFWLFYLYLPYQCHCVVLATTTSRVSLALFVVPC